ncbi:hypothetical protein CALCODRAFT_484102 [Calocera cornea HHB12733]|uniref:C2H2-type domain-containing protein n=1 Tax=Calocera cornea HHB12733 TaxID=1353952 RepID=A0A165F6X5_9BASI|nr:hypothetical protein CALCODRAFT_484102 [Calocera cornea HHB12733]
MSKRQRPESPACENEPAPHRSFQREEVPTALPPRTAEQRPRLSVVTDANAIQAGPFIDPRHAERIRRIDVHPPYTNSELFFIQKSFGTVTVPVQSQPAAHKPSNARTIPVPAPAPNTNTQASLPGQAKLPPPTAPQLSALWTTEPLVPVMVHIPLSLYEQCLKARLGTLQQQAPSDHGAMGPPPSESHDAHIGRQPTTPTSSVASTMPRLYFTTHREVDHFVRAYTLSRNSQFQQQQQRLQQLHQLEQQQMRRHHPYATQGRHVLSPSQTIHPATLAGDAIDTSGTPAGQAPGSGRAPRSIPSVRAIFPVQEAAAASVAQPQALTPQTATPSSATSPEQYNQTYVEEAYQHWLQQSQHQHQAPLAVVPGAQSQPEQGQQQPPPSSPSDRFLPLDKRGEGPIPVSAVGLQYTTPVSSIGSSISDDGTQRVEAPSSRIPWGQKQLFPTGVSKEGLPLQLPRDSRTAFLHPVPTHQAPRLPSPAQELAALSKRAEVSRFSRARRGKFNGGSHVNAYTVVPERARRETIDLTGSDDDADTVDGSSETTDVPRMTGVMKNSPISAGEEEDSAPKLIIRTDDVVYAGLVKDGVMDPAHTMKSTSATGAEDPVSEENDADGEPVLPPNEERIILGDNSAATRSEDMAQEIITTPKATSQALTEKNNDPMLTPRATPARPSASPSLKMIHVHPPRSLAKGKSAAPSPSSVHLQDGFACPYPNPYDPRLRCNAFFSARNALDRHLGAHLKEEATMLRRGGEAFNKSSLVFGGLEAPEFVCEHCGAAYLRHDALLRHQQRPNPTNGKVACPVLAGTEGPSRTGRPSTVDLRRGRGRVGGHRIEGSAGRIGHLEQEDQEMDPEQDHRETSEEMEPESDPHVRSPTPALLHGVNSEPKTRYSWPGLHWVDTHNGCEVTAAVRQLPTRLEQLGLPLLPGDANRTRKLQIVRVTKVRSTYGERWYVLNKGNGDRWIRWLKEGEEARWLDQAGGPLGRWPRATPDAA